MVPQDNQSEDWGEDNANAAEDMLRTVSQELQSIKDNWLNDIDRLRGEKSRLEAEIEQMRSTQQQLKSQQSGVLTQTTQGDQQQVWAQQLAGILANHLQERLRQQLSQSTGEAPQPSATPGESTENTYRILSSVDSTLSTTLKALQQDVSSYQSALAQQLGRMQTLEQQGEAILEALVSRLKNHLKTAPAPRPITIDTPQPRVEAPLPATPVVETTPQPVAPPPPITIGRPTLNRGFWLILMSSLVLAFQNVVTKIILVKKPVFILGSLGGFVQPTAGNALLILLMRMTIELPLLFFVARLLYPRAWRDLRQLLNKSRRKSLGWLLGTGFTLFLSQFFFYIALGNIPTSIATTIFFIYPTVIILLDWQLFGSRPSLSLTLATMSIYLGVFLSLPFQQGIKDSNLWLGITTALASGISLAIYVILSRICAQKLKLHPLPFRIVDCTTILVLSALSVQIANMIPLKILVSNVPPNMWNSLWISTGILAVATLLGLVLNHFGLRQIGSPIAPMIGAIVPALTTLLAWGLIGENLMPIQAIGIAIVTLWVLGISAENVQRMMAKKPAPANR
ncbi:EamA family transporter [Microseira sp. BLCC-F43]|jgi:drug/metabolite transporter (DMT)-like permease|uniref:DMT family transporter n=1 Tax=Microseira sp. BLCC-F43 TaxID=3153602 RepID=UPI0035B8E43C